MVCVNSPCAYFLVRVCIRRLRGVWLGVAVVLCFGGQGASRCGIWSYVPLAEFCRK